MHASGSCTHICKLWCKCIFSHTFRVVCYWNENESKYKFISVQNKCNKSGKKSHEDTIILTDSWTQSKHICKCYGSNNKGYLYLRNWIMPRDHIFSDISRFINISKSPPHEVIYRVWNAYTFLSCIYGFTTTFNKPQNEKTSVISQSLKDLSCFKTFQLFELDWELFKRPGSTAYNFVCACFFGGDYKTFLNIAIKKTTGSAKFMAT